MPIATVRGVHIYYEILGETGPFVAMSPGGRRPHDGIRPMAARIAAAGYRVVVHDRRNCGVSDIAIEGDDSEFEQWADDLYVLLGQLDARPAFIGGSSSGCRLSIIFALRHPDAVRGLLLWRLSGGRFAAERLAKSYYGQYVAAAQQGGMAAVCGLDHFKEVIALKPANRDTLMRMNPARFIAVMSRWNENLLADADLPVIGASEAKLRSIEAPAVVIPGNDKTHPRAVGRNAARLMPRAELHDVDLADYDLEMSPLDEWDAKQPEIAGKFVALMRRVS